MSIQWKWIVFRDNNNDIIIIIINIIYYNCLIIMMITVIIMQLKWITVKNENKWVNK